jgi:hypothetical protein
VNKGSTILKRLTTFVRDSAGCRLGLVFVVLHAAWFLLAIANMSPPSPQFAEFLDGGRGSSAAILAGRPFHFTYESYLLKCLFVLDLPSMIATVPIEFLVGALLKVMHVGSFVGSYFGAGFILIAGTLQWFAMGRIGQSWLMHRPSGNWVLGGR